MPVHKDQSHVSWLRRLVSDPPEECVLWPGHVAQSGYGESWFDGRRITAHQLAYILAYGPVPNRMFVLHGKDRACASRACCNPRHLRAGTAAENAADMVRDGTMPRGERSGRAVLSAADVINIRKAHSEGEPTRAIARRLGRSVGAIRHIVAGTNWAHLLPSADVPTNGRLAGGAS